MISICTPTRNRLPRLQEMMISAMNNADRTKVEFVIYVDDDLLTEQTLRAWVPEIRAKGHLLQVLIGPKRLLSNYWNDCAEKATGNVVMLANDDIVFRTLGWPLKLERALYASFPDGLGMVHPMNGQQNGPHFATHPLVTKKWIKAVGYFVPPCFAGDYTDTWINEVANEAGRRRYVGDVMVEHMHWIWGKAKQDSTYDERTKSETGMAQLYDSLWTLRDLAVMKVREAIAAEMVNSRLNAAQP